VLNCIRAPCGELEPFLLRDEHVQRALEQLRDITARNGVTQKLLRALELVVDVLGDRQPELEASG
jgi:hypothetical protein